jgi:hypothetical protein
MQNLKIKIMRDVFITYLGLERFSEDVQAMLGTKPGMYWRICWKFVSPSFIIVSIKTN